MEPTLLDGDGVLFVRRQWEINDIVLADVAEEDPVVKRIVDAADGKLHLRGDNVAVSETFLITPDQIQGVLLCGCLLKLSWTKAN